VTKSISDFTTEVTEQTPNLRLHPHPHLHHRNFDVSDVTIEATELEQPAKA
jgi:hypothetical protein